jgi:transcriptional regulator with XRE-family HTH domain
LPFYRWSLTTAKPIPGYPRDLRHVGDHLLRRRLDLGLEQKEAAKRLGTGAWNLRNWETGRHGIEVRFYPAIIAFLGYNPLPDPHTHGDAVRRERVALGWSRKKLAKVAGVDEATVKRVEADTPRMAKKPTAAILRALSLCWD